MSPGHVLDLFDVHPFGLLVSFVFLVSVVCRACVEALSPPAAFQGTLDP
jgi:hypothetical protein